jgi:multidrug efflux pump subunit AcrA (membrane-fusion protein)
MKSSLLSAALFIALAILLPTACRKPAPAVTAAAPTPPVVWVTEARESDQPPTLIEAVATLEGSASTEIRAQVPGYLVKQAYQEGAEVRAGDLLFETDANRTHEQGTPSSYTKIISPVAGVAGRAVPGIGDLLSPGMTLTTISFTDSVTANFAISASFYREHALWFAKILAMPVSGRPEDIQLVLDHGVIYPRMGKLFQLDHAAPLSSRAINVAAVFPNPDHVLRPGQYAQVRFTLQDRTNGVLIPQMAVMQSQGLAQVMVVNSDQTVETRNVILGDSIGSSRAITGGLQAGEHVVVVGMEELTPGESVTPEPYAEPPSNPAPTHAPVVTIPAKS